MPTIKRFAPIIFLITGLIFFFIFDGQEYLSLDQVAQQQHNLLVWTTDNFWLSSLIYISTYIIIVTFSIPGAMVMTLLGGYLFGLFPGSLWTMIAATIGSCLVFTAVQFAFSNTLETKASGSINKMRKGFENNAFNYLLTLRLIPIFPFFVINIAAGVLKIRLSTFFWATFIGMIPGTIIYTWVGTSLGYVLDKGDKLNMTIIFEPKFILPIIGLAVLSLVPTLYKKLKTSKYEQD